jgi:acylphosphatase
MKNNDPENKAFRATIHGRVQGVGFRYSTIAKARKLGVTGYVRNTPDGSVEVIAEGDSVQCANLLEWLKEGPPGAIVRNVDFFYTDYTGSYDGFDVEF